MKRKVLIIALLVSMTEIFIFAITKASFSIGSDIVNSDSSAEGKIHFAGLYSNLNLNVDNDFVTAGGKIYYRVNGFEAWSDASQKLDVKRAYLLFRPFGNEWLEIGGGKLYSYYLPGNFFQLSENYTGASRWGKTGVGLSFNKSGFSGGIAVPLTESYVKFSESWGLNGALVYDFKVLNESIPVKFGADAVYAATKQKSGTYDNDFSSTASVLYTPAVKGFVSKISLAASFTYNGEPYVASSVFKNVSNYKNEYLKKSNFASLNYSSNFGKFQFVAEGEAGHSTEGTIVPLYLGTQVTIPVTTWLCFKPRFYYYAALDSADSEKSRQTFEVYPRVLFTFNSWTVSAGFDFDFKQTSSAEYDFEWKVPFFAEYKIGK